MTLKLFTQQSMSLYYQYINAKNKDIYLNVVGLKRVTKRKKKVSGSLMQKG